MRKFVERIIQKVPRMGDEQISQLLSGLVEDNATLEAVFDSMAEGLIVLDVRHVPLLSNKAAERLLPYRFTGAQLRPIWEHLTQENVAAFVRKSLESDDVVEGRDFEIEISGQHRIVSLFITPLVKERKIIGTLLGIDDVTERVRDGMRLKRAENLASLTTMAAGVAHEIKNPLGSLSIRVQLLQKAFRKCSTEQSEQLGNHLAVIEEEIERLNRIVVDFLFAVRPVNVQPVDADINPIVREIAEFSRPEAEGAGVSLDVTLSDQCPVTPIDARYMKQVLLNLVKNAIAAMPSGGTLRLETSFAENEVRVSVADSGVGIEPDNLSKVFEPYFTTRDNGTGLGLTIAYKIVKEHGGEMQVRSEPGKGSVFTILLPVPQRERRLLTFTERDEAEDA